MVWVCVARTLPQAPLIDRRQVFVDFIPCRLQNEFEFWTLVLVGCCGVVIVYWHGTKQWTERILLFADRSRKTFRGRFSHSINHINFLYELLWTTLIGHWTACVRSPLRQEWNFCTIKRAPIRCQSPIVSSSSPPFSVHEFRLNLRFVFRMLSAEMTPPYATRSNELAHIDGANIHADD